MRRLTILLAFLLTCSNQPPKIKPIVNKHSCKHTATTFRCVKYIKNYDGDTITFDIPKTHPLFGKNISIRVKDIDTPEMKPNRCKPIDTICIRKRSCEMRKARLAKDLVKSLLIKAKAITLENIQRGKYFRVVADVIATTDKDKINVKNKLIKDKLAYPYDGGTKKQINWCK